MVDLAALLAPVSEAAPSGSEIHYDHDYEELQNAARSIVQEKNAEGKEIREAKGPNWPEVERLALGLCAKSKDLRVAVYLARAKLALEGLPGFARALELISGYVVRYWPSVHPQLDAAEDNDPRIRVNALLALSDLETVLRSLWSAPLAQSQKFGRVTWREYAVANGQMQPAPSANGADRQDLSRITGAFAETPLVFLKDVQAAAAGSLQHLSDIDIFFHKTLGDAAGPDFEPLRRLLGEMKSVLDREISKRGGGEVAAAKTQADGAGPVVETGVIRNRGDVVATLDRICRYYREYEPSSPIPLILERTKRLVPMGFLDILKELTPEGVKKFGEIAGLKEEKKE